MAAPWYLSRVICRLCGRRIQPQTGFRFQYSTKKYKSKTKKIDKDFLGEWQPVIGLEIHAQIQAESKMFSGSSCQQGLPVNTQVSFMDCALPGTLPVLNRRCVEAGVITALALGCDINRISKFDRKHYFYADLPAGYQITQQRQPLARKGMVKYEMMEDGILKEKTVRLVQVQLEQDSGKSLHNQAEQCSLIDLNRAGVGLMEIITEPDMSSAEEASAFVEEVRGILRRIGTCSCRGDSTLRVDINISVHKPGEPLGVRSEVKNLLTARRVRRAIESEIARQIAILEDGGKIVNETRSYDMESGKTVPLRDKEVQQDYRFMPEPNLPPLHVYDAADVPPSREPDSVVVIDKLKERLPLLPHEIRKDLKEKHNIQWNLITVLLGEDGLYEFFEQLVKGHDPKKVAIFLCYCFLAALREKSTDVVDCPIPVSSLRELLDMFVSEYISSWTTEQILKLLVDNPELNPRHIVDENSWALVSDKELIRGLCKEILATETKCVEKYKKGKEKEIEVLTRKVFLKNKFVNKRIVTEVLTELLTKLKSS